MIRIFARITGLTVSVGGGNLLSLQVSVSFGYVAAATATNNSTTITVGSVCGEEELRNRVRQGLSDFINQSAGPLDSTDNNIGITADDITLVG